MAKEQVIPPIANNKILLAEESIKLCKEKLHNLIPFLKLVAAQYGLRLNRPCELRKAAVIYVQSIKKN